MVVALALVASMMSVSWRASGQDYIGVFTRDYTSRLSAEVDPLAFVFKGYSFHLRYRPMFTEQVVIGVGTYGFELPDAMVNFNNKNRDMGWNVRIRSAVAIYGEFFPREANRGWFFGEQIGFQSYRIRNSREGVEAGRFNALTAITYAGYSWYPFGRFFYVKPWVGLGLLEKVDGVNEVGDLRYRVGPLLPYATVHLGYTF